MRRRVNWRFLGLASGILAISTGGLYWLQSGTEPAAVAAPPAVAKDTPAPAPSPTPAAAREASDYSQRVVAYIYDTIPITREQLGEYLITRYGADKLELLVNKCIIEHACKEKGVEVTQAEIEAALVEDLKGLNVSKGDFVSKVLKQYNKTLFEWKEDVIKPRLLLTKLARPRVYVTPEEIQAGYDAYYGEKVACRLIMWPVAEEKKVLTDIYGKIRDSEEEFDRAARHQASVSLAASGGRIPPVARNTTGDPEIERQVFRLRPGEMTSVIRNGEHLCVFKCDQHIPPDTTKKLEDVRAQIEQEILEKKVQTELAKMFKEMQTAAKPNLILRKTTSVEQMVRGVEELLNEGNKKPTGPTAQQN